MGKLIYLFLILTLVFIPLNATRIRGHPSKRENQESYRTSVESGLKVENGKIIQYNKNHIRLNDPMDEGHRIYLKLKENGLLDMFMQNRQPIKTIPPITTTTTTTTTTAKPEETPTVKTSAHVGHESTDNSIKHTKWQLYVPEKETATVSDSDLAQSQVHQSIDPIYASLAFSNIVTRPSVQPQVTEQQNELISHWESKKPTVPESENLIQDEVSINFPHAQAPNQSTDSSNSEDNEIVLIPVVETDTYIILFKNVSSEKAHFMFKSEKPELEFAHHVINTLIQKITSARDDVKSEPKQTNQSDDYFGKSKRKVPDTASDSSETNYQIYAENQNTKENESRSDVFEKKEESDSLRENVAPVTESQVEQNDTKLYLLSVNNPTKNTLTISNTAERKQLKLTELNHNSIPVDIMKFYEEYLKNSTAKPPVEPTQTSNPVTYTPESATVPEITTVLPVQKQESILEKTPIKSESVQTEHYGELPADIMQLIQKYSKSKEYKDKVKRQESTVQVSPQYSTIRANQEVNVELPKPVYTPNSYLEDLSQLYSKATPQETAATHEKYQLILREKPSRGVENEQSFAETNSIKFVSSTPPTTYTKFTNPKEQLRQEKDVIPEKIVQSETKNLRQRYRIVPVTSTDKAPMYKLVFH